MSELGAAVIAGMLIGLGYFGGLWWTVRQALHAQHPAWWFLVSLLLRTTLAVLGFYWIGHDGWQRLVACLAGFAAMRWLLARCARRGVADAA